MTIIQQGQANPTALVVPDLYIQIQPPPQLAINGVPTNVSGIVGTASWGPVDVPVTAGSPTQGQAIFGPRQAREFDLMTALSIQTQQGANNFRLVRVTDDTDTAAEATIQGGDLTITSKYTGSFGNTATITLSAGTKTGTYKAVVSMPGLLSESFDNVGFGLSGNALWLAIAAAINTGTSAIRGPSNLIVAAAGAGTDVPAAATYALTGGTDGVTTINGSVLLGADVIPRSGMYALRGSRASVGMLADLSDSTTYATQVAYGLSEGTYMVGAGPSGDSISDAVTTKATAGIDSYAFKLMFGDWCYWLDTQNNILRLVSPQAFAAGWLAANSPQFSSLNQPLQGIVGTQSTYASQEYADADLQQLAIAGIDLIMNPSVGGAYFSCRIGHNTSSNPFTNGDNYTRMTNYLATTMNAGLGQFVGALETPTEQQTAASAIGHFLDNLATSEPPLIGNAQGTTPYSVEIDSGNNPQSLVAQGYQIATVMVQYLSIVEKFLVNLIGGTSVQITPSGSPQAQTA
jgi:hypothetical protein